MKTRAGGVWGKVGVLGVGVALFLGGCVVQSGGPGGKRPIFVPKTMQRPAVVQAPPAETSPPPVYGRPAEPEPTPPVEVAPAPLQADETAKLLGEDQPGKGKAKGKRKGKGKAPKQ